MEALNCWEKWTLVVEVTVILPKKWRSLVVPSREWTDSELLRLLRAWSWGANMRWLPPSSLLH
jgi:hypothetical protein